MMQRVFNFSGGRTSAYMVIKYYECGDIVLFCDTGREHEKTYKFIHDFEAHEQIPVVWLAREGGFERLLQQESIIPNRAKRKCTIELKVKTARRYLRSIKLIKYENFIGFRADEPLRIKRHKEMWQQVITRFPLYEDGTTKAMVNEFWKSKDYNLEIPSILGNCDLCFMKGENAAMAIMAKYPELADKWIADEDRSRERKEGKKKIGYTYFDGVSMRQLRNIAQNNLFKDYDLEQVNPKFNCACTS